MRHVPILPVLPTQRHRNRLGDCLLFLWLVDVILAPGYVAQSKATIDKQPNVRYDLPSAYATCQSLPAASGTVIQVDTVAELQAAVASLASDTTILVADGTYDLTNTLNFRHVNNVVLRSASGNRDAVILRGKGMSNANYGNVPHVIAIYGSNDVLVADLTLRDAYFHLIQVHGEEGQVGS